MENKDKVDLNALRQSKDYGYEQDKHERKCLVQTDKVNEKIEEMITSAHNKLNNGNSSEKMMAVGIIQLVNELNLLARCCPNDTQLGNNFRQILGIK